MLMVINDPLKASVKTPSGELLHLKKITLLPWLHILRYAIFEKKTQKTYFIQLFFFSQFTYNRVTEEPFMGLNDDVTVNYYQQSP